jgi:hypothetical protein
MRAQDGEDQAGHLVGGLQGLAADLGVVNLAPRWHALEQECNTLLQVVLGDAPRLEHDDESASGIVAPPHADLVHGFHELGAGRYEGGLASQIRPAYICTLVAEEEFDTAVHAVARCHVQCRVPTAYIL